MKIAVIGGASAFTPGIIEGLLAEKAVLGGAEICLMDIDNPHLQVITALSRQMIAAAAAPFTVTSTGILDEALRGARYVLCQVRVGGLLGRAQDEQIPRRLGCLGQETTGAGGLSFAWRSIPFMLDLASRMQALCPDAHLVNYANPTGQVARALLWSGFRQVTAICDEPLGMQIVLGHLLRAPHKKIIIDNVGINHCGVVTAISHRGRDQMLRLRRMSGFVTLVPGFVGRMARLIRRFGVLPSPYLLYYFYKGELLAEQQRQTATRAQVIMSRLPAIYKHYSEQATNPRPRLRLRRGMAGHGDLAVQVIAGIHARRGDRVVVNGLNQGAVSWLPPSAVVELPGRIGSTGAQLMPNSAKLPAELVQLIMRVEKSEALNVEAAMRGDRQLAIEAMRLHPLVDDAKTAQLLVADLMEAHRPFLPQFS